MATVQPLFVEVHVVTLDYAQFYLYTSVSDLDVLPDIVDWALASNGIAQHLGFLMVTSPHQNNFEMPLRVEVWQAPPADDANDWPEAFEAHLALQRRLCWMGTICGKRTRAGASYSGCPAYSRVRERASFSLPFVDRLWAAGCGPSIAARRTPGYRR